METVKLRSLRLRRPELEPQLCLFVTVCSRVCCVLFLRDCHEQEHTASGGSRACEGRSGR